MHGFNSPIFKKNPNGEDAFLVAFDFSITIFFDKTAKLIWKHKICKNIFFIYIVYVKLTQNTLKTT